MEFRSDAETRMKLSLMEMRAVATKKFQRADRNTLGVVSNEMMEVMWEDPRFIKAFMIQYARWTVMLNRQMESFCGEILRDMKNAPQVGAAGVQRQIDGQVSGGASAVTSAPAEEGDGVHKSVESQTQNGPAPSTQSEEETIQSNSESQKSGGPSSSSPDRNGGVHENSDRPILDGASIPSPVRSGEVHHMTDSHTAIGPSAAPPNRNGAVHVHSESRRQGGRIVPIVNKARSLADMQQTKAIVKPSIFETCSIRGIPLVQMSRGTLKGLELASVYDAALSRAILDHCVAPDSVMVKDLLRDSDLAVYIENAKKKAQEVANAHAA